MVVNKKMKIGSKIFIALSLLLAATGVCAKDKANIYAHARKVPAKAVINEAGEQVKLNDFEGEFVIAVFWSRYCAPCVRELQSLSKFVEKTRNNGVRVIMISPKSEWAGSFVDQRDFLHKFKADNLEAYFDEKEAVASALGIFSSPISVLINTEGKEIGRIRGSMKWDKPDNIEYIYKLKAENG